MEEKVIAKESITGSWMVVCPFCDDTHFFDLRFKETQEINNINGSKKILRECFKIKNTLNIFRLEKKS